MPWLRTRLTPPFSMRIAAAEALDDRPRCVGRAVVDHDHLDRGMGLVERALDRLGDERSRL
jgi:hypothetical protein